MQDEAGYADQTDLLTDAVDLFRVYIHIRRSLYTARTTINTRVVVVFPDTNGPLESTVDKNVELHRLRL